MKSIKEIFDDKYTRQYLSFLVLSDSLSINTTLSNYILDFDNSKYVKVYITPTSNDYIINILNKYHFVIPEYKEVNDGIVCLINKTKNNESIVHGISFQLC
jgi:hypothetical protein